MMNQLRGAVLKCSRLSESARQNKLLYPNLFASTKLFSTVAPEPRPGISDIFSLPNPPSDLVYGRIAYITKHTTKADIINLLEGAGLRPHNLKVEYNRNYTPLSMMVEFPSRSAYDAALRAIARKSRLFSMSSADRTQWDTIAPFDGKAILMQGIPHNALIDDVERFLSGCQYHSASTQIFFRQTNEGPVRMGLVQFPSQVLATHAYVTKNGGFCMNDKISLRLLH